MVEKQTFLKDGPKIVIRFFTAPALYPNNETAAAMLLSEVTTYRMSCGLRSIQTQEVDNPYSIFVIHGLEG